MSARLLRRAAGCLLLLVLSAGAGGASSALAAEAWWQVGGRNYRGDVPPGGKAQVVGIASNLGHSTLSASEKHPIVVTDKIPAGLTIVPKAATGIVAREPAQGRNPHGADSLICNESGQDVSCTLPEGLPPYGSLEIVVPVTVTATDGTSLSNEVTVGGGEGATAPVARAFPMHVSSAPTGFGVEQYEVTPENAEGCLLYTSDAA